MTITMPTREFVGLLTDVLTFATPEDENTAWYRVVLEWDGERLHASAGDGVRCAHTSWGPDDESDEDQGELFDTVRPSDDAQTLVLPNGDILVAEGRGGPAVRRWERAPAAGAARRRHPHRPDLRR